MRTLSAKDAKYGFGRLMDLARAAPVTVAKYGRPSLWCSRSRRTSG